MRNPLWHYAERTYAADGVAATCIALQDGFGLDVNLLLYAAWLADGDRALSAAHLSALEVSVREWRDQVVKPLRSVRRLLHGKTGAGEFHRKVKLLELRAEREQLDTMYAFFRKAESLTSARRPLAQNLILVARTARPADSRWEPLIDQLVTVIPA